MEKKKIRHLLRALLLSLMLALIVPSALNLPGQTITAQAASVKISKKKATLIKGQTLKLKISGTSSKVKWSSNKKSVATVNSSGKVTAKKKGTATITAKVGSKKYTCKITVETPKISATSVTLVKGNTTTLKVSGTSQTVKWSSSKKSVATVSSKGKVTAKKAGTATITAKVGSKKYTCKVTVTATEVFDETTALSKLSISSCKVEGDRCNGVVIFVKNNYKYDVSVTVDCLYYNESGTLLGKKSDYNYCLESGNECVLYTYGIYDSSYNYVDWASYELSVKVSQASSNIIRNTSGITYNSNYGADNVMVTVQNTGVKTKYTIISIVFYKNGSVIGYDYAYADVESVGETDYITFKYPYDENYDRIVPDSYKVYVNSSYTYTWLD